ncbi:MAG: PDZ domain-containing protein [Flavobacteriales bacterium]|nr:PDZ domain-containing protein [Flavobacteriales bacterium]
MSDSRFKLFIYYPIVLALVLAAGIYLGSILNVGQLSHVGIESSSANSKKITNLLNYVQEEYVDSVNLDGLTESTIIKMLDQLDPHSSYIPARELESSNEPLNGNFDGIGVEFNIISDTIVVVAPINGGPSEKLGIRSGDRIVSIEDTVVAGTGIKNEDVISKLRGERGTNVKVEIARRGVKKLMVFNIERDKIPIYSVDAGYMVNDKVGYIKVSRFGATTYDEFSEKLVELQQNGLQSLIVDLRGNPGGYLNAAINICDEFLPTGKLIVYTEGRARPKDNAFATSHGDFEKGKLVILVDEGSASASEIVSGAVQDNDRGTIVGRRTFGKGLVQEQVELADGSAVRLTIARYYTPTGRCIQRPYGEGDDYYGDLYNRLEHGELYEADSISVDKKERFVTPGGKVVYGGGGIVPDVFVPLDTTNYSEFHRELLGSGALREFALNYASKNRKELEKFETPDAFRKRFEFAASIYPQLIDFAKTKNVKATDFAKAKPEVLNNLKALIARSKWNGNGFYPIINENDKMINAALEVLD